MWLSSRRKGRDWFELTPDECREIVKSYPNLGARALSGYKWRKIEKEESYTYLICYLPPDNSRAKNVIYEGRLSFYEDIEKFKQSIDPLSDGSDITILNIMRLS